MTVQIRRETQDDVAPIEALTISAFRNTAHTSNTEHFIVKALRKAGKLTISLVADDEGEIIGHVAVSPVEISTDATGWYGLGPISVAPERQRRGIGSELMKQALHTLRNMGASGCVLLGDPNYYSRFGFKAEPLLTYPGFPPEYFQAILFYGLLPTGKVSFHESFEAER